MAVKFQKAAKDYSPSIELISINAFGRKKESNWSFSQMSLIPGWAEGVIGMRVGGVREITIPSDLAYKDQGSGNDIPPNTPIKFIVYVIAITQKS